MKRTGSIWVIPLTVFLLSACIFSPTESSKTTPEVAKKAEVVFQVNVPAQSDGIPEYMVEVLDEVTGLPFNPVRYALSPIDSSHYFGRVPFTLGSIIKYRYVRMDGIPKVEFNAKNEQVRYRMHQVTGPAILEDTIAGWEGLPYSGPTGNLTGIVTTQENVPIPNAMVVAGGERMFTNSEGHFDLKGLPTGMQNLTVLSLDGAQSFFEQGARVSENAVTPARIYVSNQPNIKIAFEVTPPAGMDTSAPLRLMGDLYQLGNTFADLEGGMSTIASRAPTLQFDAGKNLYRGVISLPAGAYFQYKYSLGDGFWNAETDESGQFILREMVVPAQDATIHDSPNTFVSSSFSPVDFQITTPANTPAGDAVSMQFNPFSWMGSIPTWQVGPNQWKFSLSSPLNMIPQTSFRVCRNDQCGETDADMSGIQTAFSPSSTPQTVLVNIPSWLWMNDQGVTPILPGQVPAKGIDFIRGVELDRNYQPRWQPFMDFAFQNLQDIHANWVFITPTWSLEAGFPFSIGIIPEKNPFWMDTSMQIQEARSHQLLTAVYPSLISFSSENSAEIQPQSQADWEEWFVNYRSFLLFYADLAAVNQADALVLGGSGASISLPDQIAVTDLPTAESSDFSASHWQSLVADIRSHYGGKILWAQRTPMNGNPPPAFAQQLDGLYLLWDGLAQYDPNSSPDVLKAQIASQFSDADIQNLSVSGKPIIVGLWVNSTAEATLNCPAGSMQCLDESDSSLSSANPGQLDLQQQVNIYAAALDYFSGQNWVNGIVSRGYYPPAELLDQSASVHGKPAGSTLAAWFSGLSGSTKP